MRFRRRSVVGALAIGIAVYASAAVTRPAEPAVGLHARRAVKLIQAAEAKENLAGEHARRNDGASPKAVVTSLLDPASTDLRNAEAETRAAVADGEITNGAAVQLGLGSALAQDAKAKTNLRNGDTNHRFEAWGDLMNAGEGKYTALRDLGADPYASPPCEVTYPPPVFAGESTVGVTGCKVPLSGVAITLPTAVQKVSAYAIESPGLTTGPCSTVSDSLACTLGIPMQPKQLFVVAFAPPLKPGEQLVFDLTPKTGHDILFPVLTPAGPKLAVSATATENAGAAPGTSFTFHVKVAGGPFESIAIDVPNGTSPLLNAGGLSCGVGASSMSCSPPAGHTTEPAGTYDIGASFQPALGAGTVLHGSVTGTGVAPAATFSVKTP